MAACLVISLLMSAEAKLREDSMRLDGIDGGLK